MERTRCGSAWCCEPQWARREKPAAAHRVSSKASSVSSMNSTKVSYRTLLRGNRQHRGDALSRKVIPSLQQVVGRAAQLYRLTWPHHLTKQHLSSTKGEHEHSGRQLPIEELGEDDLEAGEERACECVARYQLDVDV